MRWQGDERYGDLQRVATGLLSPEPGEPWSEYAVEAVPFLAGLLIDRYEQGEGHLGAVLSWITDPRTTMKAKLDRLLKSPQEQVSRAARRMMDRSEARQGAILMALESSLDIFADPLVARHTARSDLDVNGVHDLQSGSLPVSLDLRSPFSDQRRLRPLWSCLLESWIARVSAPHQTGRIGYFVLGRGHGVAAISQSRKRHEPFDRRWRASPDVFSKQTASLRVLRRT